MAVGVEETTASYGKTFELERGLSDGKRRLFAELLSS